MVTSAVEYIVDSVWSTSVSDGFAVPFGYGAGNPFDEKTDELLGPVPVTAVVPFKYDVGELLGKDDELSPEVPFDEFEAHSLVSSTLNLVPPVVPSLETSNSPQSTATLCVCETITSFCEKPNSEV